MYTPVFLKTENELNKILKRQKRTGEEVAILFTSLWDKWCVELVEQLKKRKTRPNAKPVYIVDSFKMPHAFVIFKSSKLPHFVRLTSKSVESEDYLARVYKSLGFRAAKIS